MHTSKKEVDGLFDNLIDKIDYEYDRYYDYLVLISRPDFVSRAYEIVVKKAIHDKIAEDYGKNRLKQETILFMMNTEDLIDFIYMKLSRFLEFRNGEITDASWRFGLSKLKF